MNNCNFLGRITQDLELKYSQSGKAFLRFSIAVQKNFKNSEGKYESDFFNIAAFGPTAENINKFFEKGNRILINCSAQQEKWTDRDGNNRNQISFNVNSFDFIDSKNASSGNSGGGYQPTSRPEPASGVGDGFMQIPDDVADEGLPFN